MVTFEKPGYSGCPEELLERIRHEFLEKDMTMPVNMSIVLEEGKPAHLKTSFKGMEVEACGAEVMTAQKRPLTEADVIKQIKKTGGSAFSVDDIHIEMGDNVFLPVSSLISISRWEITYFFLCHP